MSKPELTAEDIVALVSASTTALKGDGVDFVTNAAGVHTAKIGVDKVSSVLAANGVTVEQYGQLATAISIVEAGITKIVGDQLVKEIEIARAAGEDGRNIKVEVTGNLPGRDSVTVKGTSARVVSAGVPAAGDNGPRPTKIIAGGTKTTLNMASDPQGVVEKTQATVADLVSAALYAGNADVGE